MKKNPLLSVRDLEKRIVSTTCQVTKLRSFFYFVKKRDTSVSLCMDEFTQIYCYGVFVELNDKNCYWFGISFRNSYKIVEKSNKN